MWKVEIKQNTVRAAKKGQYQFSAQERSGDKTFEKKQQPNCVTKSSLALKMADFAFDFLKRFWAFVVLARALAFDPTIVPPAKLDLIYTTKLTCTTCWTSRRRGMEQWVSFWSCFPAPLLRSCHWQVLLIIRLFVFLWLQLMCAGHGSGYLDELFFTGIRTQTPLHENKEIGPLAVKIAMKPKMTLKTKLN